MVTPKIMKQMKTMSFLKAFALLSGLTLLAGVSSCVKNIEDAVAGDGTVYAAIRQVDPEVKTSLAESVKVFWAQGDEILVYNADFSSSSLATARSAGASSEFELASEVPGGSFCAVYPASSSSASAGSDGYAVRTRSVVLSTQTAVADGFDPASAPMAAVKGSDGTLNFVNYASLLKFTLSGTGIASIVVEPNNAQAMLSGSFYMDAKDSDADGVLDTFLASDASSSDASASITLLPPAGSSEFAPGTYYVAVRPGVEVSGGLRLSSYDASGTLMRTLGSTANVTLNRGKIRSLGVLDAGSDLERIRACSMVTDAEQLSTRTLAPGIQHTDYRITLAANGSLPSAVSLMHVVRIDREKATAAGAKIRTMTAYNSCGVVYDGSDNTYTRQSIRNMMFCADTKEENVIFGTGASYNDSGKPYGPVHKDGDILYNTIKTATRPMVAVKADNTMYIGNQSNYESWSDAQKASYPNVNDGYYLSVNNGVLRSPSNTSRAGISAEGYTVRGTANGDIYFVVVDPAGYGTKSSSGATYMEVGAIMQALGCNRAAYGQSGTTTAMWVRNPQTHVFEPLGDGNFAGSPISAWGITVPGEYYSSVTDAIAGSTVVKSVNSSSQTTVRQGCTYTKLSLTMSQAYNNKSDLSGDDMGDQLNIWVLRVDPVASGMSMKVLMKNDSYTANASSFSASRLDDMAKAYATNNGKQPLVVCNGDFYSDSKVPRGPVHARGKGVKTSFYSGSDVPQQGQSFVGIRSDKTIYIGDKSEYSSSLVSTYPELLGAGLMFLKDGRLNPEYVASTGHWVGSESTYMGKYNWPGVSHPRTAIGYDADGIIYVIWADGRNAGVSKGASYVELCEFFKSLGCVRAVNLDGGKSTQFVLWSGSSYSILNDPRDEDKPNGTPVKWREIVDGIAFVED